MLEEIGGTEPTADRAATARRLRDLHVADGTDCWWCGKPWPCPDEKWAAAVLRRASVVDGR